MRLEDDMPSMTEELGRLASAIAAGSRERAEAASARRRAAGERHEHSHQFMRSLKSERLAMGRAQDREMIAARRRREASVAELMRACRQAQAHRHHQHLAMSAAERARIAAFMGELSARVASLRQELGASREARAAARSTAFQALREELDYYRRDREGAYAAWCGHGAKPAASRSAPAEARRQKTGADAAVAEPAPFVAKPGDRRSRHHPAGDQAAGPSADGLARSGQHLARGLPRAANDKEGER
jgi:outer membrane murein-binding lipoprotein Lpp